MRSKKIKTTSIIRREIIRICRRLDDLGFVPATDGNVSARLPSERIIVTPSLLPKGDLRPSQLLTVDLQGRVISGQGRPSSELKMHLEVYRRRPDIRAVVHAHPPAATAFAVCRKALDKPVLPEAVVLLGPVPLAAYATPSTDQVPASIARLVENNHAILLANHGALTYGQNLQEALERMERLEHLARVMLLAHLIGRPQPLNLRQMKELKKLF